MTILEMLLAPEVNEIIGLMGAPAFLNLFNVEIILRTLNNTIETHAKMKETIFKTSPGMEASIESHVTWPHWGSASAVHFSLRDPHCHMWNQKSGFGESKQSPFFSSKANFRWSII